jgi:ankyrin repeat protein
LFEPAGNKKQKEAGVPMSDGRSFDEMLQSTSDALFPAEMGERVVTLASKDADGDTPLHVMIWRGDHAAVRAFIEAGAQLDAVGDMGQTPLHVAVMKEDEAVVELLLRAGANPNVRSEFGDTPRELAAQKGGRVKELLG